MRCPCREVAEAKRGRAYTSIVRREGQRVVSVSGDVEPVDQTPQILTALQDDLLPPRFYKNITASPTPSKGEKPIDVKASDGLIKGLLVALLLIYVLLAIPFNSYAQPLIIMVSIPFGIVGAVLGHLLLNYSLSLIRPLWGGGAIGCSRE